MKTEMNRYEQIVGNAVVTRFRSNKEEALYNYFNDNGAYQKHNAMMDTLFQAIDAGYINSGWLIAHDASYSMGEISRLSMLKRVNGNSVRYHIQNIAKETEATYILLAEVFTGERGPNGRRVCEAKESKRQYDFYKNNSGMMMGAVTLAK